MRTVLFASRVFMAVLAMALAGGAAQGQELRTWKDGSGKFSIKAKFVSIDNGKLTLAREDGEEIEIELKKLSEADQKYVADLEKDKDNPFKSAKSDPFKAKKPGMGKATSSEARPVNANWTEARVLALAQEKGDWEVAVAPPPASLALKARAIGIPSKSGFFEKLKGMVVSADGKHAALGYGTDEPRPAGVTRLVLVDLEKGKSLGSATSPGLMAPLAVSDDGTQVLMKRDEFGFGNSDRLELWTMNGTSIAKGISFFPYGDEKGGDRDVKWAAYLSGDRAITVSNKGKLALWDLGSAKALYTLGIQDGSKPAISPDRKLLAFTTGKEVGILDVESGAVLGLKATTNTPFAALAFSPSGKKFAVAAMDKLWAYDTASGEMQTEMLLTGTFANGEVQWTDEDHILIAHQFLLDLPNQVKLWQYQGADRASEVGTTTLFLVQNGQSSGALVAAQLPQPSANAALAKAIADPEFFVLKPGATIKVVVNGLSDPSRQGPVTDALAGKLAAIGAKAGPGGTLELVATTEVGKQREITYRTMGRGFGAQSYKVQEYISRVKFVYQGKTAWESSSYNIPHIVSLRNGQTMEAYLKEQEKPNYDFFSHVELPKLLQRPSGTPTLGSSQVTASGVR
jgi:WD40 repeat protein